ncbi:HDIG domain-containing protein [Mucilaginibacter terrenus]|uniref:HDIG domain-containing protein n=1 Tax=Mucilaginibacter terrenus TaxID=2482727 RepID=A0A3E2NT77_9SPHI|nr:HDIG domain-containing metalloprotein [Mucilaginibacter terrenus]RFZ84225.1 HDIG domain-containing protein [Mucilaginibacter terrenus]
MIDPTFHRAPQLITDKVFALYELHGDEDYIGEPVSQLEHMAQAALLAKEEGYDDEVVLAAFFHDIGHLCAAEGEAESMDGLGNVDHEKLGAEYLLNLGFSSRVASLVQSHVVAKRYLTFKYPDYYNKLSPASKGTLEFQGGVMTAEEAAAFEANPDKDLIIRFRHWDDEAKLQNLPVSNVPELKQMTIKHLAAQLSERH